LLGWQLLDDSPDRGGTFELSCSGSPRAKPSELKRDLSRRPSCLKAELPEMNRSRLRRGDSAHVAAGGRAGRTAREGGRALSGGSCPLAGGERPSQGTRARTSGKPGCASVAGRPRTGAEVNSGVRFRPGFLSLILYADAGACDRGGGTWHCARQRRSSGPTERSTAQGPHVREAVSDEVARHVQGALSVLAGEDDAAVLG